MRRDAKKIARALAKEFRKLARTGELARDAKRVATAINNLRAERRLTPRELNRRATMSTQVITDTTFLSVGAVQEKRLFDWPIRSRDVETGQSFRDIECGNLPEHD